MARDPDQPREDGYPWPPHRIADGDSLWYVHPVTGERFLSATSALDFRAKPNLDLRWRPQQTAKAAIRRLPELVAASRRPDCERTNGACSRVDTRQHDFRVTCAECPCRQCRACMVKDLGNQHFRDSAQATARGSAFHYWGEQWALARGDQAVAWARWREATSKREGFTPDKVTALESSTRPYAESWLRFADDFGLDPGRDWLMAEATVLNRAGKWAGTLDDVVQFQARATRKSLELCERLERESPVVALDKKSREVEEALFQEDMALQLAGYRRGEAVLLPDGREEPMVATDAGVVVQVRPDNYGWRIVDTSDRAYEDGFLTAVRGAYWAIECGGESTLVRSHPRRPLPGVSPEPKPPPKPRKAAAPRVVKTAVTSKALPDASALARSGVELVDVPLPDTGESLADRRAATLDRLRRSAGPPHPDSPYGDKIPF